MSNHLPAGCVSVGTSFAADEVVDVRDLVLPDKPMAFVIGAMAHGSVRCKRLELVCNYF